MHIHTERLVQQLNELVEAGRLTEEDAERLRAAARPGELGDVAREMRHGHAMLGLVILALGALASHHALHRHMIRSPHRHALHGTSSQR
jgi:hypothetical protein